MSSVSTRPNLVRSLRALGFRVFYGLPPHLRRRLVRLGSGTYTLGAVVLATDTAQPMADPGFPAAFSDAPRVGKLLLVRQPPGKGWSLPAGLLERGERPIEGAARELAEETGVALPVSEFSPVVPNAVVHSKGRWVDMVFTTVVPADTALQPDGLEILEVAWHPIDALPPVTPATARLLAHYRLGPYAEYPEVTR